ncbi:condensation domain-containing protein, partial [Massilia sp.]|uniref:condensation domain-containing protein n=1 Tax=Massilia sp. TaxID=1882437 RepID=UPI00352D0204
YMVPALFVVLDALPVTANGKLDRKTLPAPGADAFVTRGHEAPQGETEEALAAIWRELLKREAVGRHDNFFELGGHSLLAVQLMSRVRQTLQVEVPLGELFKDASLAGFGAIVARSERTSLPSIAPVGRSGPLPLSFAQQRLWFLAQMEGVSQAYHISGGVQFGGALDRAALSAALNRIVARHEALRTTFTLQDGQAVQVIGAADIGMELDYLDLRSHRDQEGLQQEQLWQTLEQAANAPFDLARGPLIRTILVQLAEHEHVLFVVMHHIVSDGWSMGVLINEVSTLYGTYRGAVSARETDMLEALPIQYADYAQWQRRWVSGERQHRQADYWKSTLSGIPALLELPTDRPRPARQSYAGDSCAIELDAQLTGKLKALSQRHGVTLYMTLLAAWATLLSRLSGQTDVVIGSPVAGRDRGEIENLIGFFVNTLALRFSLAPDQTVAGLLAQSRRQVLEAQQHGDLPFEQIVEIVQPPRSLAHAPIFQAMFAWQNAPQGYLDLPGLTMAPLDGQVGVTAKFDLSISLQEAGERIVGSLEYASALYDQETMERHLVHWRTLLEAMTADDGQTLSALPLMTAAQRRQVLVDWSATEAACPQDRCLHEMFEEQAARTPDAVAVVFEQQLTYRELNARANRLAHYLRSQGVRPDSLVGICV